MNFKLPFIPERPAKPRSEGLTMMMDKGLSVREAENFADAAGEYTDFVKFGFGTSILTKHLKKKIEIYKAANIRPYFGGTLFEAFIIRDMFEDYRRYIDKFEIDLVEVSDGSMVIEHNRKLEFISHLAKNYTVLSEVGSKVKGVHIEPEDWVSMMKSELEAGSFKVIAESRESGTIGIYNSDGSVNEELINKITAQLNGSDILWEAPNGKQQVWFIKIFGANVNLGNIAPNIVIPLECLRVGLRGDTFFDSLPDELQDLKQL
jgi:phosphosulfolactate synthase